MFRVGDLLGVFIPHAGEAPIIGPPGAFDGGKETMWSKPPSGKASLLLANGPQASPWFVAIPTTNDPLATLRRPFALLAPWTDRRRRFLEYGFGRTVEANSTICRWGGAGGVRLGAQGVDSEARAYIQGSVLPALERAWFSDTPSPRSLRGRLPWGSLVSIATGNGDRSLVVVLSSEWAQHLAGRYRRVVALATAPWDEEVHAGDPFVVEIQQGVAAAPERLALFPDVLFELDPFYREYQIAAFPHSCGHPRYVDLCDRWLMNRDALTSATLPGSTMKRVTSLLRDIIEGDDG
ncbi:MAG: hypothetical protein Q8P41_18565 [Pseudomonadota bacterium]|nr:hypothetical protein [Pseudomonadota bacterium]